MSAATLAEAGIVMQGQYGDDGARRLDALLLELDIETIPLTAVHAAHARDGFRRSGKGQHPARLNTGDCYAYGLARSARRFCSSATTSGRPISPSLRTDGHQGAHV